MTFFGNGVTVFRDRRPTTADPYNPARNEPGAWSGASSIEIPGAYIGPASSVAVADPTRAQVQEQLALFCAPTADVQRGDRIREGGTLGDLTSGIAYLVLELPDAPRNPFTGWQPVLEAPLERVVG